MSRRDIHIDDLKINLRGVDASQANDVSKRLPEAINAQLHRSGSLQRTDERIRIKGSISAAQMAKRIAEHVVACIRRETKGTEK